MEKELTEIQEILHSLFDINISREKIAKSLSNINESLHFFPEHLQQSLIIKLISEWKKQKTRDSVSASTEICRIQGGPCITMFGVLSPDWPGLSNTCMGVINEMGYNIYFVKGFSLTIKSDTLGVIIIAIRIDQEEIYDELLNQSGEIIERLRSAASMDSAKAFLISEEIGKLEIYGRVIPIIQEKYKEDDLDKIIGMSGEAVKFFAARSKNYIENRKIEDIADQIITNFTYIKNSQQSGTIQLCIKNIETKAEGVFTGVTITGPAHMLNLEDCLKTIELSITNFQLKHNREFTTDQGISLYRIEFVDPLGHALSEVDQSRLERAFSAMVLNKRRDKAQWIESIGGFEQYARAIIPLLVKEATQSDKTQIYHSVTNTTELSIDFKVIGVISPSAQNELKKNFLSHMINTIENVNGIHILSVKPARKFGATKVFIIDLRASLTIIDNIESVYEKIREKIRDNIGVFRDFDEGMRTIDGQKFKAVRQRLEGVEKTLVRELYYSIEDFYRISASVEEILDLIHSILETLYSLETRENEIMIQHRQIGSHAKDGRLIEKASLLIIGYPHEFSFITKIMDILETYEVTFSRIERIGWDILACMVTKNEKALSEEEVRDLSNEIEKLQKIINDKEIEQLKDK